MEYEFLELGKQCMMKRKLKQYKKNCSILRLTGVTANVLCLSMAHFLFDSVQSVAFKILCSPELGKHFHMHIKQVNI